VLTALATYQLLVHAADTEHYFAWTIQTQLSDAGQVAVATDGRPAPFTNFAAGTVAAPGMSLSLWRVTAGQAEQLAVHGPRHSCRTAVPSPSSRASSRPGSLPSPASFKIPSPVWPTR
jgi:hypothetical protein